MKKIIEELQKNPFIDKYRLIILPVFSVVFSLIVVLLLVIPQIQRIVNNQKDLESANKAQTELEDKANILEKVDLDEYKENLSTALAAIPPQQDTPAVLGEVLFLIGDSGMKIDSLSFTQPSKDGNIESFSSLIGISGTKAGLDTFLNKARKVPRIMKVLGLSVTSSATGEKIQASITLASYFQGLPTVLGNIDQPVSLPTEQELAVLREIKSYQSLVPVRASEDVTGPTGKSDPFQ